MNNYLIDTHCHMSLTIDIDTYIDEAKKNNVLKYIISGCDKSSISQGLEILSRYEDIYMTVGFHPDVVDELVEDDINNLKKLIINNNKIVGIGEIGLDYYHNDNNKDMQRKFFRMQLELAQELKLPVVIHSRDSIQETYDILKEYNVTGVIHCYSGSLEMAELFIKLGYKLGIGGVLTFKNSKLKDIVKEISLDNIVLETDSPYLSPEPLRGRENSSKNVKVIAQFLANIKNTNLDEIMDKTTQNALDIFKLTK